MSNNNNIIYMYIWFNIWYMAHVYYYWSLTEECCLYTSQHGHVCVWTMAYKHMFKGTGMCKHHWTWLKELQFIHTTFLHNLCKINNTQVSQLSFLTHRGKLF